MDGTLPPKEETWWLKGATGALIPCHNVDYAQEGCSYTIFLLVLQLVQPYHWWATFLCEWNGSSFIPQQLPEIHVLSEASGSFGCGDYFVPFGWYQLQWPTSWADYHITEKELLPIVLSVALWDREWQRTHVCFHCNNMKVVEILQAQSGKGHIITYLLHCLFSLSPASIFSIR